MENLNAENIKRGLECCANNDECVGEECPYYATGCENNMPKDALALINSQEQRIKELAEEKNKAFEKGAENLTRLEEAYLKLECENLKLTEENERLRVDCVKGASALIEEMQRSRTIQADTVRKMQERVLQLFPSDKKFTTISRFTIGQIAKEMLESENERQTDA